MRRQIRRARAVIFHPDGKILLIERRKNDEHYFVLPGGHVEDVEAPEWTVIREVKEETSLDVTVNKLLYVGFDGLQNQTKIYLCNYLGGEPTLPPQSKEASTAVETKQFYGPAWFTPEELRDQTVYPVGLFNQLEVDVHHNFADNPKDIPNHQQAV